jgi:lipooligosaccharide transport system permease protein
MSRAIAIRVLEGHARAYRHTWRGTTISAVLTPVLFLAAMGLGLGSLVDTGGAPEGLGGVGYLAWLAPGLLAASTMQNGAADGSFPVVAGIRWTKNYHATLNTPVRPRDLLVGNLLWAAIRATVAGGAFVLVAAAFGAMPLGRGVLALGPALLLGVGTCAATSAFSATTTSDQALSGLFRFVVVPLFLFSGAFFPIAQLPAVVQPVVVAIPVWHGVELARAAALGTTPALHWAVHLAALVALLVVGTTLAIAVFERRLRR